MDKMLADLAEALRERLAIIGDEESRRDSDRHTERLREVSERIEQIERNLPPTIDPQLRHFLQRRSYSKALELLERADNDARDVTRSRVVEEEVLNKLDEPASQ
jgi:phytoene dehydrogenase-like protein